MSFKIRDSSKKTKKWQEELLDQPHKSRSYQGDNYTPDSKCSFRGLDTLGLA